MLRILVEEGVGATILAPGQAGRRDPPRRAVPLDAPVGRRIHRRRLLRRRPLARPRLRPHRADEPGPRPPRAGDGGRRHAGRRRHRRRDLRPSPPLGRPRPGVRLRPRGPRPRRACPRDWRSCWRRCRRRSRSRCESRRGRASHGIERWRSDCGCSTGGGPGWNQAWRAPLREALDLLRDHGIEVFERRGEKVFDDPWATRDAYVDVLLGVVTTDELLTRWARPGADAVEALALLEAQRQALLMYTSCGWFFNDLAGLETVQVLRYAARLLDLLDELGEADGVEHRFLEVLGQARSNRPEEGSGVDVWRRHVVPSRVDAGRVVAHLALLDLLEQREALGVVGGHRVVRPRAPPPAARRGGRRRRSGRARARPHRHGARRTCTPRCDSPGLEVVGAVRPADDDAAVDDDCFRRLDAAARSAVAGHGRAAADRRVLRSGRVRARGRAPGGCRRHRRFGRRRARGPVRRRAGAAVVRQPRPARVAGAAPATRSDRSCGRPSSSPSGGGCVRALAVVAAPEGDDVETAANAVREATDAAWEAERLAVSAKVADDRVAAVARRRGAGLRAAGPRRPGRRRRCCA